MITFADCNGPDGKCRIRWGGTSTTAQISKSEILSNSEGKFAHVQSAPYSATLYDWLNGKSVKVRCPVDVEIYHNSGTLVGRVVNNDVDYNIPIEDAIAVIVEGDEKTIVLPSLGDYTFKLTGTNTGSMDFSITDIDLISFNEGDSKEFANVSLFSGKEMTATFSADTDNPDIKLYVTEGDDVIAEIGTDGTETPIGNGGGIVPGGSDSGSDRSSGGSRDRTSASTSVTVDPLANLLTRIKTAVENAAKETPAGQLVKAIVRVKNADKITLAMLKQAADAAKKAGGSVILHFDTMSADGKTVLTRLFVKFELATGDINLSTNDTRSKSIKSHFEKYFKNKIAVVSFDHQGSFGIPVEIAGKVDLAGMDTKNLYFYSCDKTKNTYTRIERPDYWIDKNGYLHFTTTMGGDIIISNGNLLKK